MPRVTPIEISFANNVALVEFTTVVRYPFRVTDAVPTTASRPIENFSQDNSACLDIEGTACVQVIFFLFVPQLVTLPQTTLKAACLTY